MPKLYIGNIEEDGTRRVYVARPRDHLIRRLRHWPRHSPDGHNWGYQGSGPAECAKDILADLFEIRCTRQLDELLPPTIYQQFKRDIIGARLDGDNVWALSADRILQWGHFYPWGPETRVVWERLVARIASRIPA
jgi:hypothetical protein